MAVARLAVKAVVKKDKKDTIALLPSRSNAAPQSPSKADRTMKPATTNRTSTASIAAHRPRRLKVASLAHAKAAADAVASAADVRAAEAAVDVVLGAAVADAAVRAEVLAAADVAPAAVTAEDGKHKVPRLAANPAARSG